MKKPGPADRAFLMCCYKPDSVITEMMLYHLSTLPTLLFDRGLRTSSSNFCVSKKRGIHGISTHKVCPLTLLPEIGVSSYLTFSPLHLI